jgi:hypothetical protein
MRLLPAAATGLAIFLVLAGVPVALGFVSYALGLTVLAILTLAGLWLAYRTGIVSALAAVFVALLPAALAVGGTEDLRTARRTVVAETAVAQAPEHPEAQVLILRDARVAAEYTLTWTARAPSGADMHHAMAPVVPPQWQRGEPVPAWRVCSGGDADWCVKAMAHPVHAMRRLDKAQADQYRPRIAELARRFDMHAAPNAPVLQLTTPPAERAAAAITGMIFLPVLGFAFWLLGLLAWRGLRRLRAR